MADYYDGLGTPVQLGGDLQNHASGSLMNVNFRLFDAPVPLSVGNVPLDYALAHMHMCVHQGQLHVVWVELEDDGVGDHFVKGPYVKRWNGSTWEQLGAGIVDDNPYANLAKYNYDARQDYGVRGTPLNPWLPLGERTFPARPKIASDGETLYVAYTMHVAATVPEPPENGWYFPSDPYGVVVPGHGAHDTWYARAVFIRTWDESSNSWPLLGEIPATTNNNMNGSSGNTRCSAEIELAASPTEPGVCYVTFGESGYLGTFDWYITSPSFFVGFVFGPQFFTTWEARLVCVRYEGGFGVGQTLRSVSVPNADTPVGIISYQPDGIDYPVLYEIFNRHRTTNASGEGLIFWGSDFSFSFALGNASASATPVLGEKRMTRWSDLATLQTFDDGFTTFSQVGLAYAQPEVSEDNDVFDLQMFGDQPSAGATYVPVRQVQKDGLTPFEPLDGDSSPVVNPLSLVSFTDLAVEDPDNVWAAIGGQIWLYHRPCQGWTNFGYLGATLYNVIRSSGYSKMVILGDYLYVAGGYFTGTLDVFSNWLTRSDLRISVMQIPIIRNQLSCQSVAEGLHARTDPQNVPFCNPNLG